MVPHALTLPAPGLPPSARESGDVPAAAVSAAGTSSKGDGQGASAPPGQGQPPIVLCGPAYSLSNAGTSFAASRVYV